jgi:hypothetical protein
MTKYGNLNCCTRVTKFARQISWHVPEVIYRILLEDPVNDCFRAGRCLIW